ncbi:endonuclease/exonuclease/phosphatase family protein [Oxalobacteraceae bacterium OTU3REALA1]|nr:endonuclease/exonuclease/phosphatase family protein [Oxalobacteraceae bacterium OTU3REALA1]
MTFTVLAWNLQRLVRHASRYVDVYTIIETYRPDVMFLSEVSHDLEFAGYREVGHALSLNASKVMGKKVTFNQLSTKLLVRVTAINVKVTARAVREGGENQPRLMIKANINHNLKNYIFRFVHSKASQRSAAEAVSVIKTIMKHEENSVVMGDMNLGIEKPAAFATAEAFGQKVVEMNNSFGTPVASTHSAGKKFDWACATADLPIVAVSEKADTMRFRRQRAIGKRRGLSPEIPLSDHRPIIYQIG